MMRVSIGIMLCFMLVNCEDQVTTASSPIEGFLQTVNKALPVLKKVFNSVLRKVNRSAFRATLSAALSLVDQVFPTQPPPHVPETFWGEFGNQDTSIRNFTVHFSNGMISDLRDRLYNRRFLTRALNGTANTFGTNAEYLDQFLDYWADGYDFGAREKWLNSFPQYITNIQGLDIHFIHMKPPNRHRKKVLPLLMLHGFPLTAFEYVHVIEHLLKADVGDFVLEIIVPDLPGYGYSEPTYKVGMAPYEMGIIMKNLMLRLGKPQFYIHSGDVGQAVGDAIAVLFPERVLGVHTNFPFSIRPRTLTKMILGQLYPPAVVEAKYENRIYPLVDRLQFYLEHFGYFHMQASKPDNIGHGLVDSPVAMASWLIEILMMATDPKSEEVIDGNLPTNYNMDDFYDSYTIHWTCGSMATAARSYVLTQGPLSIRILMTPTSVPFAAINFRHEVIYQPDDFLRDKYPNLVHSTTLDFGGHFAGYQNPGVLADSILASLVKMEQFHRN